MRKAHIFSLLLIAAALLSSCVSDPYSTYTPGIGGPKPFYYIPDLGERTITLEGVDFDERIFSENADEYSIWVAYKEYPSDSQEVLFQIGFIKADYFTDEMGNSEIGFLLYGNGSSGIATYFVRQGLDLRWDWGDKYQYTFIIEPDGTGLYIDFTNATDGMAKPRAIYATKKVR